MYEQDDGWPGDYKNFDNESSADLADQLDNIGRDEDKNNTDLLAGL